MKKVFLILLMVWTSLAFSQSIDYKFLEELFEQREYSKCLGRAEKIIEKGTDDPLPFFFKSLSLSNLLMDKKTLSNYIDPYRECLDNIASAKNFAKSNELFSAYKKETDKFQRKIVNQAQKLARKGMENEAEFYLLKLKEIFTGNAPFEFVLEADVISLYLEQLNNYLNTENYQMVNETIDRIIKLSGENALALQSEALAQTFKEKAMQMFIAANNESANTVFDLYSRFNSINKAEKSSELNFKPEFEGWTQAEIDKANTAANEAYLTQLEKRVVLYINLVRINPELFCNTYLDNYVKNLFEETQTIKIQGRSYDYKSLIKNENYHSTLYQTLKKQKPLNALAPDKHLFLYALCWAEEAGKLGVIGHNRKSCAKGNFAECCQYGYDEALLIVLDLLIDEGIPSFGHRNIILGNYSKIGVSFRPHSDYDENTVIDFW